MSGLVLIGAQWGDEGKGKITNYLAERADMVVRFQGGANAGHTVAVGDRTVVFHLLPSGISRPRATCVIGPGVVLDPLGLVAEIDTVSAQGIAVGRNLLVDVGAHLVLPYHKAVEAAEEAARGAGAIGTTHRGIGPAYADRCTREGIRAGELARFDRFRELFEQNAARRNELLVKFHGAPPVDVAAELARLEAAAARIAPHLADTPPLVRSALSEGKKVLFEGAQGSLLDVAFGTYPFVTSSHTTAAGVAAGAGVPPSAAGDVVGVAKAYTTRVGAGPFPTEAEGPAAELIRERGAERGATTGRPRRCGWFDAVAVRHSAELSGMGRIVLTKLDVLDAFERIPVCVAYEIDGRRVERFPRSTDDVARARPIFEDAPGWKRSTRDARATRDLPAAALEYVRRIERLCGVPVAAVSVGAAAHAIVEFQSTLP
ncbi:MAG: adenylosuccinate synthase [Candidatus Eisenbacteria bacterium]|nr:adenylosuccinate synthase [Candidatus Eisenbacteria bacterium]